MWPDSRDPGPYTEPPVPTNLIKYTCGHTDFDEFLRSGFEVATMFNLAAHRATGRYLDDFERVLDFGCGAGRVARFLGPGPQLDGCDINPVLVDFCSSTLPRGEFHLSPHLPPLAFPDATFDLVYAFSVFSHLRQDVEEAWLAELARVGRPGCLYLLTVQGDWMIESTLPTDDLAQVLTDGFLFRGVHRRFGRKLDFPDYYESSYHTSEWVREHWSEHFDVVDIIRGDHPAFYLEPGQAFGDGPDDVPLFRPMGQDLVVARRR